MVVTSCFLHEYFSHFCRWDVRFLLIISCTQRGVCEMGLRIRCMLQLEALVGIVMRLFQDFLKRHAHFSANTTVLLLISCSLWTFIIIAGITRKDMDLKTLCNSSSYYWFWRRGGYSTISVDEHMFQRKVSVFTLFCNQLCLHFSLWTKDVML